MPERARYIPGVPCWIGTNQPAPEAAAAFYSGLFDWKVEDVMPAGSEVNYFIARIRGGDVAGIGPIPSAPRRSRPRSATRDRAAGPCLFFCSPPSDPPSKAARARPFEGMQHQTAIVLKDPIVRTMTAGVGRVKCRSYFHSLRKRRRRETSRVATTERGPGHALERLTRVRESGMPSPGRTTAILQSATPVTAPSPLPTARHC